MIYSERLFRQTHGYGCEPTTLFAASLAISAASAVATGEGQNAAATQTKNYQNSLTAANNASSTDQISSLRIQQSQDAESRTREMEKARLATQKASSTATVAAGEAGVTGHSVDAVLGEYQTQLGQFREASLRQGQLNSIGGAEQIKAVQTNTAYSNLQIKQPVSGANYAAIGLQLGGQALGAYGAYNPSALKKSPTPAAKAA